MSPADGAARGGAEHGSGHPLGPPPLPPPPPPLPYAKRPTEKNVGKRKLFQTNEQMLTAQAVYDAALHDPVRKAIADRHRKAKRARVEANRRRADPINRANQAAGRQNRRVNQRSRGHRDECIARGACSPEMVLSLHKEALERSKPFHIGVLGGCRACSVIHCSCVERFMCTHCGAYLFPAEAKPTKVSIADPHRPPPPSPRPSPHPCHRPSPRPSPLLHDCHLIADNSVIVPYSPYLLRKYRWHTRTSDCSTHMPCPCPYASST